MISVTELRSGTVFEEQGPSSALSTSLKASADKQYFLVLSYEHIKMGRGSGNVKVKVKDFKSGSTLEKSFITGAKVQEIDINRHKVQFLYQDGQGFHFMDSESYEQFTLSQNIIGDLARFLKEGMELTLFSVDDKPLYVEAPKILEYKVTQTGGSARGNTVGASQKDAILENGLTVKVPLFIKIGEVIRVDTRTGQYVERAKDLN